MRVSVATSRILGIVLLAFDLSWDEVTAAQPAGALISFTGFASYLNHGPGDKSPDSGTYEFLGCFQDSMSRVLPNLKNGANTFAECVAACSNYSYLGQESNGECWCGNSYEKDKQLPDSQCGDDRRGRGWTLSIFRTRATSVNASATCIFTEQPHGPSTATPIRQCSPNPADACVPFGDGSLNYNIILQWIYTKDAYSNVKSKFRFHLHSLLSAGPATGTPIVLGYSLHTRSLYAVSSYSKQITRLGECFDSTYQGAREHWASKQWHFRLCYNGPCIPYSKHPEHIKVPPEFAHRLWILAAAMILCLSCCMLMKRQRRWRLPSSFIQPLLAQSSPQMVKLVEGQEELVIRLENTMCADPGSTSQMWSEGIGAHAFMYTISAVKSEYGIIRNIYIQCPGVILSPEILVSAHFIEVTISRQEGYGLPAVTWKKQFQIKQTEGILEYNEDDSNLEHGVFLIVLKTSKPETRIFNVLHAMDPRRNQMLMLTNSDVASGIPSGMRVPSRSSSPPVRDVTSRSNSQSRMDVASRSSSQSRMGGSSIPSGMGLMDAEPSELTGWLAKSRR
eukprot:gnl/MRDRNA2_/MRDRNA2_36413_c0_seq1.p1 gnl/MRDRNA2_/MRDRNA2_36413_c0~~gnl/MRDRNA2_/MRDRNA2_36413_c0_seq1.p1  ORF type:complete len:563 (-),score=48.66 gnl/MRDRNA2_/MRDRNA2_36413_c0_seq1:94-1782(-)